jgi:glycosyltransferase involved in cell wall biosynthesis
MTASLKVTASLVARNEASLLAGCLEGLGFADDILVLDMESADDTRKIATEYGARVVSVPLEPVAERVRNVAFEEAGGADWVFFTAPDERLSPRFGAQLRLVLEKTDPHVAAYRVPVTLVAFGRKLRYGVLSGAGNQNIRLVRPARAHWPGDVPAHTEPTIDGEVENLFGRIDPIEDHGFRDIAQVVEKLLRYAPTEAQGVAPASLLYGDAARFAFRNLVVKEAWRDGTAGIFTTGLITMAVWVRDCYTWERLGYPEIQLKRWEKATLTSTKSLRRGVGIVRRRVPRYLSRAMSGSWSLRARSSVEGSRTGRETRLGDGSGISPAPARRGSDD